MFITFDLTNIFIVKDLFGLYISTWLQEPCQDHPKTSLSQTEHNQYLKPIASVLHKQ